MAQGARRVRKPPECGMDLSLPPVMAGLLANFLDIRAVWRIGLDPDAAAAAPARLTLLVFADSPTLQRLHKHEKPRFEARFAGLELLVVTDGDLFESAWGSRRVSGSLARCAWRQHTGSEAFYDESRWASDAAAGTVVRVRRKAVLVWRARTAD